MWSLVAPNAAAPSRSSSVTSSPSSTTIAAWINRTDHQRALWPGVIELTAEFYGSLVEYAVPLGAGALSALRITRQTGPIQSIPPPDASAAVLCSPGSTVRSNWREAKSAEGAERCSHVPHRRRSAG